MNQSVGQMTSWPLTVDLPSGLNARHGAPCHSGQGAMCCEVTEGLVSIAGRLARGCVGLLIRATWDTLAH